MPQKLNVTSKKFQLTSNLVGGVKFIFFKGNVICEWSLTNKNELQYDTNSEED